MKRNPIILLLVGLFACAAIAWLAYSPSPAIRFIEFRDGLYYPDDQRPPDQPATPVGGRMAVFRITNDSRAPYSFFGYGPSSPFYLYRVPTDSGWAPMSPRKWGDVPGTIPPHATLDIEVRAEEPPFAIGIRFERGTAEQLQSSSYSRSRTTRFFYRLRSRIDPNYLGPEPTWSTVVQAQ